MTAPNILTAFRLACVPLLVAASYGEHPLLLGAAWALFNAAALSDWLDGYLARKLECRSRLGNLMDPVVDKILILSVLFVLADGTLLPVWLVLLNMAREFMVTAVRHARTTPTKVEGANWMGKTKFCLQVAVAELGYLLLVLKALGRASPFAGATLFWSAVAMTVASYAFLIHFALSYGSRVAAEMAETGD